MGTFLAFCIIVATTLTVNAQQNTCIPSGPPFFTKAATRLVNPVTSSQYFIMGGMFDVHNKGTTAYDCATEMSETGFINMLAFFWSIDTYFNSIMSTNMVSVHAIAFDNCMRPDQTIQNMYDFAQCRINIQNMEKENLIAYVGSYTNEDAQRAGSLASDLGLTIFSPMTDSNDINVMNQKLLLKMKPSFTYDLQGMVAFLNSVNAGYVMIIYSGKDPFWKGAFDELSMIIKNSNVNVVPCIQYTADQDSVQVTDIVDNLSKRTQAKYIIPLMSRDSLNALMSEVFIRSNSFDFIFILSSRIGRDISLMTDWQSIANNTIIIDQDVPSNYVDILKNFSNFLLNLTRTNTIPGLNSGVGNGWITEYMANKVLPVLDVSNPANSPLLLSVYRTILSVNAIMKGMDSVVKVCKNQFCGPYRNEAGKIDLLYNALKGALALHMSNSGDLMYNNINYTYYIFTRNTGASYRQIGTFSVIDSSKNTYTINNMRDTRVYGYAFSEPACPNPGYGQCCEVITTTAAPTTTMTFNGTTSVSTQSTTSGYSNVLYPIGQAITGAFGSVDRKDSEYGTRFDINQKWIIALGVLAGFGILCVVVFEIFILYKLLGNDNDRQWRTIWLGQLLLLGIFICYLVLFAYIPIPTKTTCGIIRFGVGVSYAFCFAVLLVKLMIILSSKPSDKLLSGEFETPNYLKGTYQVFMFIFAVGVQIVIDVQWLITVPPEAVLVTSNSGERVWVCNHYTWKAGSYIDNMASFVRTNFENHLMSLIYIMFLILIITFLSLKSHGIITNNRESIFIGISAGFSIPIWLAWGLIGGLNKNHDYAQEFGDACIAFGLLITATLILFVMFLPKIRHFVNTGVEGIYLEDVPQTIYGDSVILAPSSYKSKGSDSVFIVNNQGIYSEPVVISNGDPMATHLKHPGSVYSTPGNIYSTSGAYLKHPESIYGGSTRVLRYTDDLRGRHPQKRSQSEVAYGASRRSHSHKGTLPRSRSQTNLGAL